VPLRTRAAQASIHRTGELTQLIYLSFYLSTEKMLRPWSQQARQLIPRRGTVAHLGKQGCCVRIHTGNLSIYVSMCIYIYRPARCGCGKDRMRRAARGINIYIYVYLHIYIYRYRYRYIYIYVCVCVCVSRLNSDSLFMPPAPHASVLEPDPYNILVHLEAFMHESICSADGPTHTESNKLYRKVKHRYRPNLSPRQRPTAKARLDQAALAASAEARGATHQARPRSPSRSSLYCPPPCLHYPHYYNTIARLLRAIHNGMKQAKYE